MELLPIPASGELPGHVVVDDFLEPIIAQTLTWYDRVGFHPPWAGYVALEHGQVVGVCGFKTAPREGRVEIAYGTRPGFEGQGIATRMAATLIGQAQKEDPEVKLFAQTLPEENASTRILTKLGFQCLGPVEHPEDGTVWEWELR